MKHFVVIVVILIGINFWSTDCGKYGSGNGMGGNGMGGYGSEHVGGGYGSCICCNRLSGRYCGSDLNRKNDCGFKTYCEPNVIYWCESTYNYSRPVRECTQSNGPCLQVDIGSARCQNKWDSYR